MPRLLCAFAAIVTYTAATSTVSWYQTYFGTTSNVVAWGDKYFACMYAMLLALFGGDPEPEGRLETAYVCMVRFIGPVLQARARDDPVPRGAQLRARATMHARSLC